MKLKRETLRFLKQAAVKSNSQFHVAAAIIKDRRVINIAHCFPNQNPDLYKTTGYRASHAEFTAIKTSPRSVKNATLIVIRVLKDKETLSCAKPCQRCQKVIDKYGIRHVYYSDWDGKIKKLRRYNARY